MFSASARAALILGTILQLALVVVGHFLAAVAALFGPIGVLISLVAGLAYAARARSASWIETLVVGAVVGGVCALIGIAVSFLLGDVLAFILLVGTVSSAVTGLLGAVLGRALTR
jgi:hypothetical protein